MNRSRWTVLVLVVLALGMSVAYGLRGHKTDTNAVDLRPLQQRAALAPCPKGLGPALPDRTLGCLGGGADVVLRAATTGRPTLVNVYASWCAPCKDEMPVLRQLHALAGDRLDLVGVDTNDDPSNALHFAIDLGQHWPALVDDDKRVLLAAGGTGPPITLFLDAKGKLVHVEAGPVRDLREARLLVQRYLGVTV